MLPSARVWGTPRVETAWVVAASPARPLVSRSPTGVDPTGDAICLLLRSGHSTLRRRVHDLTRRGDRRNAKVAPMRALAIGLLLVLLAVITGMLLLSC